jgi:chromosome partition protein MukB
LRTRAHALALVNWRGVFYRRYLLDRHVTALEGANGAGKTTVMIAAYVVLLPDMSRLRFTNLGETGATGGDKGIYGRLGERGRPSYAAIDFILPDGTRLLAGVHLERKGEPTVEPRPFIVRGLAPEVRLQDLLLVTRSDVDEVPELPEVRAAATRLGGQLQTFESTKEYFAALFDAGVTPLRLSTDEDRNKFNEMLRTSMTGGISRALTSELRGFLLREDGGLASTLGRMRANLDACRHTRLEVQEARRLEAEISGVQEAGSAFFRAACFATRAEAEEGAWNVGRAQQRHEAVAATVSARAASAEAAELHRAAAEARRRSLFELREAARQAVDQQARAWETATRRAGIEARLSEKTTAAAAAADQRAAAEGTLTDRRAARLRAAAAERAAAEGVADQQRGLDELHRRAAEHRRVTAALETARAALQLPDLTGESAGATAREVATRLLLVDEARRTAARRLDDLAGQRRDHDAARAALAALDAHAAPDDARAVLKRLDTLAEEAAQIDGIAARLAEVRAVATKQAEVRARAVALGVAPTDGAAAVAEAALQVQAEQAAAEVEEAAARQAAQDAERAVRAATAELEGLNQRAGRWGLLLQRLETLKEIGLTPDGPEALARLRGEHADRLAAVRATVATLSERREALALAIRDLGRAGGALPTELLRLRDVVDGELLATRFEETPPSEAALLEARLGPLVHAIQVADPAEAARKLAAQAGQARKANDPGDSARDTVWLVGPEFSVAEAHVHHGEAVVVEGGVTRVTRLPTWPTLGRRARARRIEGLEAERALVERQLDAARTEQRGLRRVVELADEILADVGTWQAGDPQGEIAQVKARRAEAEAAARLRISPEGREARARRFAGLRALLADAALLDPPDRAAEALALSEALAQARTARTRLAAMAPHRATLERHLDALRQTPPDAAAAAEIQSQIKGLEAERDALARAGEALVQVASHPEALSWAAAGQDLAQKQDLAPVLQAQVTLAAAARERAEAELAAAEAAERAAMAQSLGLAAECAGLAADRDRVLAELEALGVADPSPAAVAAARAHLAELQAEDTELSAEVARLAEAAGGLKAQREQAEGELRGAREALRQAELAAVPAAERWESLQKNAVVSGVSPRLDDPPMGDARALWALAEQARVRLTERVGAARGGVELQPVLEADALTAWCAVRDWLQRRVPAQVAEADDPVRALEHLRDHLIRLEERLVAQEAELRGDSENVARTIDVQIRQAGTQVRRLERHLTDVRFGSIEAMRVQMKRVEAMERVLNALRQGETQELLFQVGLPIEEALAEIFKRFGDGRTGGQRLLDYREYIELSVEIRRQGSPQWELAQPTRLSTGEAIGVGAALMMVVLTEWEHDSTLLRGRRTAGSLRFLFLDEANRLSHDNLGVLFELCRTLDLQLLIAAPEVARAEGNTTYRLVRQVDAAGREEVEVFGRRVEAG